MGTGKREFSCAGADPAELGRIGEEKRRGEKRERKGGGSCHPSEIIISA